MSNIDYIATYLESQGEVGGATGWALVKDFMPGSPATMVGLYENSGLPPEVGFPLRYPDFQVKVRAKASAAGASAAKAKLASIYNVLHDNGSGGVINATLATSHFYCYVKAASDIITLGRDEQDRMQYTQNYNTAINE